MRFSLDCLPCYMRQALDAAKLITSDIDIHEKLLRESLKILQKFNRNEKDFETHGKLYKLIKSYCPNGDPFIPFKKKFNDICLALENELTHEVINSQDPFNTAVRISLAGNLIDSGVGVDLSKEKLINTIQKSFTQKISQENIERLRNNIAEAKKILYIGDNAGEIVFDKIFIKNFFPTQNTIYVVRGGPAMNDSTIEDAEYVGMNKLVKVITTGIDLPAAAVNLSSNDFRKEYYSSDLIISKGMGNFEALMDQKENIFFLLKIKCEVVLKYFQGKYRLGEIIIDSFNDRLFQS